MSQYIICGTCGIDIERAVKAHESDPRGGYGDPIDYVIEQLCKDFEPGDYTRMAGLCSVDLGLPARAVSDLACEHGAATSVMSCTATPAMNYVAASAVDTLRLMLAALDQAGLSVAGQRAVVQLLEAESHGH